MLYFRPNLQIMNMKMKLKEAHTESESKTHQEMSIWLYFRLLVASFYLLLSSTSFFLFGASFSITSKCINNSNNWRFFSFGIDLLPTRCRHHSQVRKNENYMETERRGIAWHPRLSQRAVRPCAHFIYNNPW